MTIKLPEGFGSSGNLAGVMDRIDDAEGLRGWAVDKRVPRRAHLIRAMANSTVLATSFAALPRPDLARAVGTLPRGGFAIGWHMFARDTVRSLAAAQPDTVVELILPEHGATLQSICSTLTVRELAERLDADRTQWRRLPPLDDYARLREAGLLTQAWYRQAVPELAPDEDALLHYLEDGEASGLWPNPYFDPSLVAQALDLPETGGALRAYIDRPDALRRTSLHFDQDWYVATYDVGAAELPLAVHLCDGRDRDPNPTVRQAELRARYPDAATAPDPYVAAFALAEASGEAETLWSRLEAAPPTSLFGSPLREGFHFRRVLVQAGLLDVAHYLAQEPTAAVAPGGPAAHFAEVGDLALRSPHPWFDPLFYCRSELKAVPRQGALRHYLTQGERAGLRPCSLFETRWYQQRHAPAPSDGGALIHYLRHRSGGGLAPNSWVDLPAYVRRHPELGRGDAFAAWQAQGAARDEPISDRIDLSHIRSRYLGGSSVHDPLATFLDLGLELGWAPLRPDEPPADVFAQIAQNTAPQPAAEPLQERSVANPRVAAFALLLPEAEGDARAMLARGLPRLVDQLQPRIPKTIANPWRLARLAGLAGFCLPLPSGWPDLPADPTLRFLPVWTDGRDEWFQGRIALGSVDAVPPEVAMAVSDSRCLQIDKRPVLILARAYLAGDAGELRHQLGQMTKVDPILLLAQGRGADDPRKDGYDGAVDIPVTRERSFRTAATTSAPRLDPRATTQAAAYGNALGLALGRSRRDWPILRTVVPDWDDEPRRPAAGLVLQNPTPASFETWLRTAVEEAEAAPLQGSPVVIIDGWNSWADGSALLPDVALEYARLNAVARALEAPRAPVRQGGVLVISGADPMLCALATLLVEGFEQLFGLQSAAAIADADGTRLLLPREGAAAARPAPLGAIAQRIVAAGFEAVVDLHAPDALRSIATAPRRVALAGSAPAEVTFSLSCDADQGAKAITFFCPDPISALSAPSQPLSPPLRNFVVGLADLALPARPRISVVIPSWCSELWLPERLESIFAQTHPIEELILLDDASPDASVSVARDVALKAGREIRIVVSRNNSGNVSRQWLMAAELARGDYLWIAEADDIADPRFLARMVARIEVASDVAFAFCDSSLIDAHGQLLEPNRKPYAAALGDFGLMQDGTFAGREFAKRFLAPRNLVLTASAVLWRKDRLIAAFADAGAEAFALSAAGDWRLYLAAAAGGGSVAYVAEPLATQRRHRESVTALLAKARHFQEIMVIHELLARMFPCDPELHASLHCHRDDLRKVWGLEPSGPTQR